MKFGDNTTLNNKKTITIVIGNEKGGAGKTTTAMHLITSLLVLGFKVTSVDVDSRQKSLSRYIENREMTNSLSSNPLVMPLHNIIPETLPNLQGEELDKAKEDIFLNIIESANNDSDFIIIDTPGNNTFISNLAHSHADIIITPLNDSFVDLDVLAKINATNFSIEKPTHYSQMIWEQKMKRAGRNQESIEWIVLRNRLTNLDAKNKRNMTQVINKLANRIGFRHIDGFSERVIFRELFLKGITLVDLMSQNIPLTLSHIGARQELTTFLKNIQLSRINEALLESKFFSESRKNTAKIKVG